jgi:hypothetical protein
LRYSEASHGLRARHRKIQADLKRTIVLPRGTGI